MLFSFRWRFQFSTLDERTDGRGVIVDVLSCYLRLIIA
jgi:hypothetical protein